MPYVDLDALREQIPMRYVLELLGVQLLRQHLPWKAGPCPHGCCKSQTVCGYNFDLGRWHCRACNRAGDQLDLWQIHRDLGFLMDVASDLCRAVGIAVPYVSRGRKRRGDREEDG